MNFIDDSFESLPQKRKITQAVWFPWLIVLIILVALLIAFSPFVIVRSGHRGVATFFGDMQGDVYAEGLHWKYPLLRIHQFDVTTQTREISSGVVTEDMQLVTVGVTVSYHLDTDQLRDTFDNVGEDYASTLIDPAVKDGMNAAATQFTAEKLISEREDFKAAIFQSVQTALKSKGISVNDLAITEVAFSKTLQEAFEAKSLADQEAAVAKERSETAQLNAQTDVSISAAEMERIRTIGEALKGNEAYIQYEILQKWDGKTPLYLAPTTPVQVVNGESN